MNKFKSISDLIEFIKNDDKKLPFQLDSSNVNFEWIDIGSNKGVIVPSFNKYNSTYVYRGQYKRYQPCKSSLGRDGLDILHMSDISLDNRLDITIYEAKLSEFNHLLDLPRKILADKIGLEINVEALAQHYGLKTIHLDVTHCLKVASFFACCKLNDHNKWEPVSSGFGVMYRLPVIACEIVGVQVYPRPREQLAESVKVDINQDFELHELVDIYEFEHSYDESKKIFDYFKGGKDLFPYDPLSEKVDLIIKDNALSINTIKRLITKDDVDDFIIESRIEKIKQLLNNRGKGTISDRLEYQFDSHEIESIKNQLKNIEHDILNGTGCRMAYVR